MAASCARALSLGAVLVAATSLLQGCKLPFIGQQPGCKITDVYSMIQVNGRSGLSQEQLNKAGVELCARYEPADHDTYGGGTCNKPIDVFPDGELQDALKEGEKQPVLLVKCPGTTGDEKGEGLQRVTCSTDIYFDKPDGPIRREPMLHVNGERLGENCLTDKTGWELPTDLVKAEDADGGSDSASDDGVQADAAQEGSADDDGGGRSDARRRGGGGGDDTRSDDDGRQASGHHGGDRGSDSGSGDGGGDPDGGPAPSPWDGQDYQGSGGGYGSASPPDSGYSPNPGPTPEPYEPYWVYEDRRRRTPGSDYIQESALPAKLEQDLAAEVRSVTHGAKPTMVRPSPQAADLVSAPIVRTAHRNPVVDQHAQYLQAARQQEHHLVRRESSGHDEQMAGQRNAPSDVVRDHASLASGTAPHTSVVPKVVTATVAAGSAMPSIISVVEPHSHQAAQ